MSTEATIKIGLDKYSILLVFLGSLVFVLIGYFLWTLPESFVTKFASVLAISFFGLCALVSVYKFFDYRPGIEINSQGINDNSSFIGVGQISWNDVNTIHQSEYQKNLLFIFVSNPNKYLSSAKPIKRTLMKLNYLMFGTPVCISSILLNCKIQHLVDIINEEHKKHDLLSST